MSRGLLRAHRLGRDWPMLGCIRWPGFDAGSGLAERKQIGREEEKEKRKKKRGKERKGEERKKKERGEGKWRGKRERKKMGKWVSALSGFETRIYSIFDFSKKVLFLIVLRRDFNFK